MTNQQLTEKYRPETFDEFKGSELVSTMLQRMVEQQSIPSCMMFTGPKGVGKTSMARILDGALNPEGSGLSYLEVDAASNSGVDNIRNLQETIRYSHPGNWRIVVLDEAHNLSNAAFNALLKVLEDPPNKTVFILITTKPTTIPDTVKSRATVLRFHRMEVPVIARRLVEIVKAEGLPSRDPKVLVRIAEVADGAMRDALHLLQRIQLVDNPTVETVNILSGNTVSTKDLMYAMLTGDLHEVEVELSGVFDSSSDVDKMFQSLSQTLKEFHRAGLINNAKFLSCMSVLWNMRKLQRGDDAVARTQMEAGLFAMFAQNFWNGEEGEVSKVETALTSEDIHSLS